MPFLSIITGFVSSTIGKIGLYILIGGIVVGIVLGLVKIHDSSVKNGALAEYNKVQLEQALKDREKFEETVNKLKDDQAKILKTLQEQNTEVKIQSGKLNTFLKSKEIQAKDGPANQILKETLRQLKEGNE